MGTKIRVSVSLQYLRSKNEARLDLFVTDAENPRRGGIKSLMIKDWEGYPSPEFSVIHMLKEILESKPFNLHRNDEFQIVTLVYAAPLAEFPKNLKKDVIRFIDAFEMIRKQGLRQIRV